MSLKPGDITYAFGDSQLPPEHQALAAKLLEACHGNHIGVAVDCLINTLVTVAFKSGHEDDIVEWLAHAVSINKANMKAVKQ